MTTDQLAIAFIAALTALGVVVRPFGLPEAVWAVAGAALLVVLGLVPPRSAVAAVAQGDDVYLFLAGMMLLSESARREGLFDWIAASAVNLAHGSQRRLFALIFCAAVLVTTFLSNDATAVVMTPAVIAAARRARARPLPYLYACAFVANCASFVLPISNPANLVVYGERMPPLGAWFASFALPSVAAIAATYACLRFALRRGLSGACEPSAVRAPLSPGGWVALAGIVATAACLLTASWLDRPLGLPTCVLGGITALAVAMRGRAAAADIPRRISWSVFPLVGGLFVIVQAMSQVGVVGALASLLSAGVGWSVPGTAAIAAGVLAVATNLVNNLPAGLLAGSVVAAASPPQLVVDALLIAVDLGPNLSITGSLATILWLTALRREGEVVSFWQFLKIGVVVMPPALLLSLCSLLLLHGVAA